MKSHSHTFHLKVQKVEQICLFELAWGQGQSITVQVDYPAHLTQLYQDWRRAYLNFYQSDHLRGRAVGGGVAPIAIDWHQELVKAETKLLYEFHRWLRAAELYEIRAKIAAASQAFAKHDESVQVFLTCAPIDLDRFPWETWELGTEFASLGAIQLIRAPLNIKAETHTKSRSGRPRILAILGDDTGLNFEADRQAIRSLLKIAEVKFVGWQPDQTPTQVITQITDAIADPLGWDVLFFAGHSNETELTGGELGIAPGVSISIHEITPQLIAAKKRGLQVAIFNSCSGLTIAESLIDLGFGQVVVMREPIHNRVAQEFLVRFLQGLGKHLDVYDSILEARQSLRMEKNHTYPSASIVPSLFCHPGAELYQIPPIQWKQSFRRLLPTRIEAIALSAGIALGLAIPMFQLDVLRDVRMWTQAVYRDRTAQMPADEAPPIALIQIDTESLQKNDVAAIRPLDRTYIADILKRVQQSNAKVVGLDTVFDNPQKNVPDGDKVLGNAVRRAVSNNMWLTFAALLEPSGEVGVSQATGITNRNWTMHGYIDAPFQFVQLPDADCTQQCPIAYLLALTQSAHQEIPGLAKPSLDRTGDLRSQLFQTVQQQAPQKGNTPTLRDWKAPMGLQPMLDFSIRPNLVYDLIPAWKLLDPAGLQQYPLLSKQIVLIAPGSDERLGLGNSPDRFSPPLATNYWTKQPWLTGGEMLAYMTHHWLKQHLITPIPDLWMVGIAIILGKAIALLLYRPAIRWNQARRLQAMAALIGLVAVYGLITLQLYISAFVMLPWLLPSSVFLAYVLPATRRKSDG